nr:IS3 family transposase [Gloeobacter violaceus]
MVDQYHPQAVAEALDLNRASVYRFAKPADKPKPKKPHPAPPRSLQAQEKQQVLSVLRSERFVDQSPRQIYATLLDEGTYLCSYRTMYRLLAEAGEVRERRHQRRQPLYSKPELLATAPNQLWSWDITKLKGPQKAQHYHLYVLLDVYSRCVVGWLVAAQESAELAEQLIAQSSTREGIARDQLTIHSERGAAMTSRTVAVLLSDLGITKSHSRPHVSNDNPYSESQFKTMKYQGRCPNDPQPQFPERFGSLEDARAFCQRFFAWYNHEHCHSGIGLMPPASLHTGEAHQRQERRRQVLAAAYTQHPDRFVRKIPEPPALPEAVWINKPKDSSTASSAETQPSCSVPDSESRL